MTETIRTIHLLQKRHSGGSLALRWSDEEITGHGLNFEMAANDLAERREKAGVSPRPTQTGTYGDIISGI